MQVVEQDRANMHAEIDEVRCLLFSFPYIILLTLSKEDEDNGDEDEGENMVVEPPSQVSGKFMFAQT